MIARQGALIFAIVILSFIAALLIADLVTPGGFSFGESIASFLSFPSVKHADVEKCDCEYSSELKEYICNPFCGELSGTTYTEKADCMI